MVTDIPSYSKEKGVHADGASVEQIAGLQMSESSTAEAGKVTTAAETTGVPQTDEGFADPEALAFKPADVSTSTSESVEVSALEEEVDRLPPVSVHDDATSNRPEPASSKPESPLFSSLDEESNSEVQNVVTDPDQRTDQTREQQVQVLEVDEVTLTPASNLTNEEEPNSDTKSQVVAVTTVGTSEEKNGHVGQTKVHDRPHLALHRHVRPRAFGDHIHRHAIHVS